MIAQACDYTKNDELYNLNGGSVCKLNLNKKMNTLKISLDQSDSYFSAAVLKVKIKFVKY